MNKFINIFNVKYFNEIAYQNSHLIFSHFPLLFGFGFLHLNYIHSASRPPTDDKDAGSCHECFMENYMTLSNNSLQPAGCAMRSRFREKFTAGFESNF